MNANRHESRTLFLGTTEHTEEKIFKPQNTPNHAERKTNKSSAPFCVFRGCFFVEATPSSLYRRRAGRSLSPRRKAAKPESGAAARFVDATPSSRFSKGWRIAANRKFEMNGFSPFFEILFILSILSKLPPCPPAKRVVRFAPQRTPRKQRVCNEWKKSNESVQEEENPVYPVHPVKKPSCPPAQRVVKNPTTKTGSTRSGAGVG